MSPISADVVVVGAGIIGSGIAYHLAKRGADVLLVDRARPLTSGTASGASAGGIRQQGRVAAEVPLAIESAGMWGGLANELGMDLGYRQHGMVICVDDTTTLTRLRAQVSRERSMGLNVRIVETEELHRIVPRLSPCIIAGSYCKTDGYADPIQTTRAFFLAAGRLGARVSWESTVIGFRRKGAQIVGVEMPNGSIACQTVVLAAGPWSHRVAEQGGIHLSMLQEGFLQMLVTARCPHMLDQVLAWAGRGISLKQIPSGEFLIGGSWPGEGDLEHFKTRLWPGSMAKSAATATELFPRLAAAPIVRAWVGIESYSRDDYPIISSIPGHPGLIVVAGFSGHGFALAPAVGRLVAEWILTSTVPGVLKPFDIRRFDQKETKEQ